MPPAAWARVLGLQTIFKCKYKSLQIPTLLQSSYSKAKRQVLVDSGATDNFISEKLLKRMKIGMTKLKKERTIWNVDGTHNKSGAIKHYVDLQVQCGDRTKEMRFLVTDIGERARKCVGENSWSREGWNKRVLKRRMSAVK